MQGIEKREKRLLFFNPFFSLLEVELIAPLRSEIALLPASLASKTSLAQVSLGLLSQHLMIIIFQGGGSMN